MNIFQFVVFGCVLDVKCSRKTVTEVMAGTGLQCLSVMHQSFDGIGCNGAGKFLLIGFAAFNNGNGKNVFAKVRIYV